MVAPTNCPPTENRIALDRMRVGSIGLLNQPETRKGECAVPSGSSEYEASCTQCKLVSGSPSLSAEGSGPPMPAVFPQCSTMPDTVGAQ